MENPQESSMTVISAGLDSCLQHWMKTQRREINFTMYPGAKKKPGHPATSGRGRCDRSMELSAAPGLECNG